MKDSMGDGNNKNSKVAIKGHVGFFGATTFTLGAMIGSGIFISAHGVLKNTRSVGLCLVVWAVCGVISIGEALCFAELGTMIPKQGGVYVYLKTAKLNFLAFACALLNMMVRAPAAIVITGYTFSTYAMTLMPICGEPACVNKFLTCALIVTLYLVNVTSTGVADKLNVITTLGKLVVLSVIIIVSFYIVFRDGTVKELDTGFAGTTCSPQLAALAVYSAKWAFNGCQAVVMIAEDLKKPAKILPPAIICGVTLVTIIYVLTNISYFAVLDREEIFMGTPATTWANKVLGAYSFVIPVGVMISAAGMVHLGLYTQSRLLFAAARDRDLPEAISYIHVHQKTPICSMTVLLIFSLILTIPTDVDQLINYSGIFIAFYNALAIVTLIIFRFTKKNEPRAFKVPFVIVGVMLLVEVYLVIAPLVIEPKLDIIYCMIMVIGVTALTYIIFIFFKITIPFSDEITAIIQLVLQSCPETRIATD